MKKLLTTEFIKKYFILNWSIFFIAFSLFVKFYFFNTLVVNYDWIESISPIFISSAIFLVSAVTFWILFLPQRFKKSTALILNITFSIIIISDLLYLRYFQILPSVSSLQFAGQLGGVKASIKGLFLYKDFLFLADLPFFVVLHYLLKKKSKNILINKRLSITATFACIAPIFIIGLTLFKIDNVKLKELVIRGYDNKFLSARYSVLGYHLVDIYRFSSNSFNELNPEETQKILAWLSKEKTKPLAENNFTRKASGKNIIVIQVESLQNFVVGKKIENQEITPNINKFLNQSHYFDNHNYHMGLGGTSDSDFSVNTSLYPSRNASVFVRYGRNKFTSLPHELKKANYSTNVYHGYFKGFWNREIAFNSLGFDNYYSSVDYPQGTRIELGLNDTDFLTKTADYIEKSQKPSFNYVITLSSHHPFYLPPGFEELDLDKNKYTDEVYRYYQSIHYADKALGIFMEKLKSKNMFYDSLIVLYGDHDANLGDRNSQEVQNAVGFLGSEGAKIENSLVLKKIPLFIKLPNQQEKFIHSKASGHIDIMPTILNLTGKQTTSPMFGRDLFSDSPPFFASVLFYQNGIATDGEKIYINGDFEDIEYDACFLITPSLWQKIKTAECSYLDDKRKTDLLMSEKIIENNLLSKLQK